MREIEKYRLVERSISKKYRKEIWRPFIAAVKRYELISEGDRIAVCISGGKDSMLLAVLMRMLTRISEVKFDVVYLVMDPGYSEANRRRIEDNAALLHIPVTVFETDIFDAANKAEKSPCYLCARMRRGYLYSEARKLGCNKIALGHHMNDVIETTLIGLFYGSQLQAMMPKLHSKNFPGMELIRPMYCIREDDVIAWARYNELSFLQCACRFTERDAHVEDTSKRRKMKALVRELMRDNPDVEKSVFNSIHDVCLDTFPSYKTAGKLHSFLESYDGSRTDDETE